MSLKLLIGTVSLCVVCVLLVFFSKVSVVTCNINDNNSCPDELTQVLVSTLSASFLLLPQDELEGKVAQLGFEVVSLQRKLPSTVQVVVKAVDSVGFLESTHNEFFVLNTQGVVTKIASIEGQHGKVRITSLPDEYISNTHWLTQLAQQLSAFNQRSQQLELRNEPISLLWKSADLLTLQLPNSPLFLLHPNDVDTGLVAVEVLASGKISAVPFVVKEVDVRFRLPVARAMVTMGELQLASPSSEVQIETSVATSSSTAHY